MKMEALRSAVRFTVGFLTIVGVSLGLTLAVGHIAAKAPNNEKAVATPASVYSGGDEAALAGNLSN